MNLIALLDRARNCRTLDERYAVLMHGKRFYKPNSKEMKYLVQEIEKVQFRHLRKENRAA